MQNGQIRVLKFILKFLPF